MIRSLMPRVTAFLLMTVGVLLPGSLHAASIESVMRALQERWYAVNGTYYTWPSNASYAAPGPFPQDGFYAADMATPARASMVVGSIGGAVDTLSYTFLDSTTGSLEGLDTAAIKNMRPLGITVTSNNYRAVLPLVVKRAQEFRYIKINVYASLVSSKSFGSQKPPNSVPAWPESYGECTSLCASDFTQRSWFDYPPGTPWSPTTATPVSYYTITTQPAPGSTVDNPKTQFGGGGTVYVLKVMGDSGRFTGSVDFYLSTLVQLTAGSTPGWIIVPDNSPVTPDGKLHKFSSTSAGGPVSSAEAFRQMPVTPPSPPAGPTTFGNSSSQIWYQQCAAVVNCSFTPITVPDLPLIDLPDFPDQPTCKTDQFSRNTSWVDNVLLTHEHRAIDYAQDRPSDSGCSTCSGTSLQASPDPLAGLRIERIHRYDRQDEFGSFGPGVFLSSDIRLHLHHDSNRIEYWNPQNRTSIILTPGTPAGVYVDAVGNKVTDVRLYDASSVLTGTMPNAKTARITELDGTVADVEIIVTEQGTSATSHGRLTALTPRGLVPTTFAYQFAANSSDVTLGYDKSRLWNLSTITDPYGKQAQLVYGRVCNRWAVTKITVPNAQEFIYRYDTDALVGLTRIQYPGGDVSTFHVATTTANGGRVSITYVDAGAEDIHRNKTVDLTGSSWIAEDGAHVPQLPSRVREVRNGAGEVAYRNALYSTGTSFATVVYEGTGGLGSSTVRRLETFNGHLRSSAVATNFTIGQDPSTYQWTTLSRYATNAQSRVTQMTDEQSRRWIYQVATNGDVTQRKLLDANAWTTLLTTTATFNAMQQPLTQTNSLGQVTQWSYDTAGRPLSKDAALGLPEASRWSWTYNTRGQPLTATDANGNVITYVYHETAGNPDHRRLVAIVEPKDSATDTVQATTVLHYDAAGRLSTVTDAANRTATYGYDLRGRRTSITYADTTTETWTYGTTPQTANLVVTHKDRNNNVESFTYDNAGRRTGMTIAGPSGTPVVGTQSWTYLPGKELVKTLTDNGELITYGYDYLLRQTSATRTPRNGASLVSRTAYDATGRVSFTQDPYGRRTYFQYDSLDHVSRRVQELTIGALTIPGDDAGSVLQARSAQRTRLPNPAYTIAEESSDSEGQVRLRIDARGYRSAFEYDGQGRLTAQVQSANYAWNDPSANQPLLYAVALRNGQWVTFAAGFEPPAPGWFQLHAARTEYQYDDQGNRTVVIKPKAFTRTPPALNEYGKWDVQPYASMFRSPDPTFTLTNGGYRTVTTYTGRNLVKSVTESPGTPDEATVEYSYTLTKKKATESDPRNSAWKTTYAYQTCCDRVSTVTDAAGKVTTYTYDGNGNVLTVRDPNNVGVTNTYDPRNRLLTSMDTRNLTTSYAYDDNLTDGTGLSGTYAAQFAGLGLGAGADGSAVRITNPLSEIALEIRDGVGRVVRRVDGNLNATTAVYDVVAGGLIETQVVDALGNTTRQQADAGGRVRVGIDAAGQPTTALFDANGNQVSLRDPNNVGWTTPGDDTATPGYDLMNRLVKRSDTHGDAVQYAYDLHGNQTGNTDARNQTETCAYDYRDRKVQCTDRVGGVTTYTYDKANHLTKIADADSATNGVTDYTYDSRGLLESETFPAGVAGKRTRRTYAYDNGRRLATRTVTTVPAATPALNEVTTYGYDNANRLTGRTYNDGKGNDTFAYDNANRLTQAVSGRYGATVDRVYTGNTPAEKAGRLTSEKLTLSGQNAGNWTVKYQYDAANRLTTLTYPTNETSVRTYTPRNQLNTVTFAGATVATRTYDNGGRLSTTTFGNSQVETRTYRSDANGVDNQLTTQVIPGVTNFSYAYDANKRITQETNNLFANQTQQFLAYDNANRLTSWQRGSDTQTWTLSKVGDWQSTTINGVAQSRTHSAVHEISAIGAVPLSYDLKGNLTQNLDGALYGWDSENRMASATVADATYGVNDTATYRYDALGRRVQKTVYGMATTFIHAGAQVVHEFDAKVQLASSAANDDGTGAGTPPGGGILQGAGVTRYNFQPSLSPIPPGFHADKGKVFAARSNGKSYGWLTTARTDTVIRNQHPLPQFDSFNQAWLNNAGTAGTWEIALANGTYAVVVVMGDAASANQTDNVTIEGQAQSDPDPAVATPPGYRRGDFDGYAVTANVTDGKLTLAFPATATNPKLCFIEIGAQGSSITQADRDRLAAAIEDASSDTGLLAFPKAQPTPRQYVYGSYIDEPLLLRANGTRYYYASNRLYSVAAISNQSGAVVERYKYDAYGKQAILADNGVVQYKPSDYGQSVGFTGRYHDWETGLTYFRTRYEDTTSGRFINRMPWFGLNGLCLSNYSMTVMNGFWRSEFRSMLSSAEGSYVQGRYNLYDFMFQDPGNTLEPFSRGGRRPGPRRTPEEIAEEAVREEFERGVREGRIPVYRDYVAERDAPPQAPRAIRDWLTPEEQARFDALRAQYPDWMPDPTAPARPLTPAQTRAARDRVTCGRGHHRHPLSFEGEPNPAEGLVPTGEGRTAETRNPIHREITNFWNSVLRRLRSENFYPPEPPPEFPRIEMPYPYRPDGQ